MRSFKPSNFFLIFLFMFTGREILHSSSQQLLNPIYGAFILDLGGGAPQVASFASQWTINGAADLSLAGAFPCSQWAVFGHPGLLSNQGYFERIYSNLPAHVFIFFNIPLFIMDNWAATDYYEVQFDNRIYYRAYPSTVLATSTANYCGGSQNDMIDNFIGRISHTGSTLTIKIRFQLSNNAWLGLKDLGMTLSNDTSKTEYKCSSGTGSEHCLCGGGFYKSFDSSCQPCHANCSYCFGPSDNECQMCKFPITSYDGMRCRGHNSNNCVMFDFVNNRCGMCSGILAWDGSCKSSCNPPYLYESIVGYGMCNTPCQSNSTFMLWDGTCAEYCDFPLIKRIEGYGKFCDYPCNSSSTLFLYSNGSCLNTCEFLNRTVGGYKFCDACSGGIFMYPNKTCQSNCVSPRIPYGGGQYNLCVTPCQSNNTYLSWNNTCVDVCQFPFRPRNEGSAKFCDFPCDSPTNPYLYSNGSCLSSCDFFTRTVQGYNFCDNCPGGGFLYPNHTCLATCLLPRIAKVENQYDYCLSPCDINQFYYIKKATCRPTCEFPNRVDDTIFCVIDVSEGAQNMLDTLCSVLNVTNQVTSATIVLSNIVSFSNPAAVLFGSMSDIISYIKYLRINYPPRLRYLLDQPQSEGLLQSVSSIPQVVKNLFVNRDLPEEFEKYDIQSSFVVNFWQNYIILAAILCIIILIYLIQICISRGTCLNLVLKVNQIFKWNLFISFSIGYYGDLAFFSYLEIKTSQLDSLWPIISFIASLITTIGAFALLFKIVTILRKIVAAKTMDSRSSVFKKLNIIKEKWKGYEVTFANFKDDSLFKLAFLPIYIIRIYFFNIIITSLFEHPLIQTVLVTLTSFFMLVYLINSRPFKEMKSLIENIVQETILMVINICVLILASLDEAESDAFDTRNIVGDIIIFVNSGFSILGSIYLNIQLLYHLIKMLFNFIKKKSQPKQPRESKSINNANREARRDRELEDNHSLPPARQRVYLARKKRTEIEKISPKQKKLSENIYNGQKLIKKTRIKNPSEFQEKVSRTKSPRLIKKTSKSGNKGRELDWVQRKVASGIYLDTTPINN